MASINNPASVTSIGAKGAAGQAAAVAGAGALAREIESQTTGPTAETEQPRSAFDQMPHRYIATNPAADEAWRDVVSLQPHFGQDQLLGARAYDPAMVEYLAGKRDQTVQRKFDDLVLSAFDPLDPAQRMALEGMMPSLVQSKVQVYEMCEEQKRFIFSCSLRAAGQIGRQDWARLVRLLGGGEPLLSHPIDKAVSEEPLPSGIAALFGSSDSGGSALRGIFSFMSATPDNRMKAYPNVADTRARRVNIAKLCLQHFPRYLTGAYNAYSDGEDSKTRTAYAAATIVQQCEMFVAQMQPLGNFVEDLGRQPTQTVPAISRGAIDGMFLSTPQAR